MAGHTPKLTRSARYSTSPQSSKRVQDRTAEGRRPGEGLLKLNRYERLLSKGIWLEDRHRRQRQWGGERGDAGRCPSLSDRTNLEPSIRPGDRKKPWVMTVPCAPPPPHIKVKGHSAALVKGTSPASLSTTDLTLHQIIQPCMP